GGLLHRPRRKADLAPLDRAAVRHLQFDPFALNGVTILHGHARVLRGKMPQLGAALARIVQALGERSDGFWRQHWFFRLFLRRQLFLRRACRLLCLSVPLSLNSMNSSDSASPCFAYCAAKCVFMMSNRPAQVACLAAVLRPAPIFSTACTNPASCTLPSAMQNSSHGMARTRTPPGGNTGSPSTRSSVMYCASSRHSSPKRPAARRLALYSSVMCDMLSFSDSHIRDGATDGEHWNRAVVLDRTAAARGRGNCDEGADLESALTGVAIGRLVRVRQQRRPVVDLPALQKLKIPGFVDFSRVGRSRPVRDAAGAHEADALGDRIGGAAQRSQRRPLAVDVHRNDGQIEARRQEMQRHHDAVIEFPLFRVRKIDGLHHLTDEPSGKRRTAGHRGMRYAEPLRVLDRTLVAVSHAHCERGHVVHEEIREVL